MKTAYRQLSLLLSSHLALERLSGLLVPASPERSSILLCWLIVARLRFQADRISYLARVCFHIVLRHLFQTLALLVNLVGCFVWLVVLCWRMFHCLRFQADWITELRWCGGVLLARDFFE